MKSILFLFLFIAPVSSYCQDKHAFTQYINDEKIGQLQTKIDQDSTIYETRYLGTVNMKEGSMHSPNVTYHVLSQFYSVKAALTRHGHSRMIFLFENGETARIYTLSMPEELPISITNNRLSFPNGAIKYLSLPPLFCIPGGSCYE